MLVSLSALQIAAATCAIVGFFATFVALATPAWQIVYAREIQQWIQSGLWLSCQTRPSGMYTCTYTFSESDFAFYTSAELINLKTPPFFSWQRHLLGVFLKGQLFVFLAFASLALSLRESTRRLSGILFVVAMTIATILHIGSILAFAIFSQMVEYRFYHVSVSGIYEKHRGYSFFIEMGATALLIVGLVLGIAHLFYLNSKTNKSENYYQQQNQQRMFDEEPYTFQQRNVYSSNNNIGENSFCSSNFLTPSQNFDFKQKPIDVTSYQYSMTSASGRATFDPYEETAFAMRDLPQVPSNPALYHR